MRAYVRNMCWIAVYHATHFLKCTALTSIFFLCSGCVLLVSTFLGEHSTHSFSLLLRGGAFITFNTPTCCVDECVVFVLSLMNLINTQAYRSTR